jgi:hypothetical protein
MPARNGAGYGLRKDQRRAELSVPVLVFQNLCPFQNGAARTARPRGTGGWLGPASD